LQGYAAHDWESKVMTMQIVRYGLLWLTILFSATACMGAQSPEKVLPQSQLSHVDSELQLKRDQLRQTLNARGVKTIQTGQQLRLIVPADKLFQFDSSKMRARASLTLDEVNQFLSTYKTVAIKVAGFTDGRCFQQRNQALSELRAQQVAAYLWNKGLDTRVLEAVGRAHCYPIASGESKRDQALNRRIEISTWEVS
jgi:outer membrane protein OmpA-like peptidoglycan-associated protein